VVRASVVPVSIGEDVGKGAVLEEGARRSSPSATCHVPQTLFQKGKERRPRIIPTPSPTSAPPNSSAPLASQPSLVFPRFRGHLI
jgi:hypothetical protein